MPYTSSMKHFNFKWLLKF